MSGEMTQPTACVAVFEKHPYWGPELQRQLISRNLLVRECRTVNDLAPALTDFESGVILLDLDSSPVDCLTWLGHRTNETIRHPVIACASADASGLEWTVREAGAIGFVSDEISGHELARLCLRQLRLT